MQFMLCAGTGCLASGSMEVKEAMEKELKKRNLQDEAQIITTGCNGFCARGPVMVVYPDGVFYNQVKPEQLPLSWKSTSSKGVWWKSSCSRRSAKGKYPSVEGYQASSACSD